MIQDEFGDKGAFKIIKVNFILAQTISDLSGGNVLGSRILCAGYFNGVTIHLSLIQDESGCIHITCLKSTARLQCQCNSYLCYSVSCHNFMNMLFYKI